MPTSLQPPDPEAVLLCQIPGMQAAVLLQLVEHWPTPASILRAPSSELRALGLPPALVARVVAAPRQRPATEAGLKGLERMGIVPLPLLDPRYPERLRRLPAPPLLLHVQGGWPPPAPALAFRRAGELDDVRGQEMSELLSALAGLGIPLAAGGADLRLLPPNRSTAILPFGLLLARSRVPDGLRDAAMAGRSTLVSVGPVNAPATPPAEETAWHVLLALADGLLIVGGREAELPAVRPELHIWHIAAGETGGAAPTRTRRSLRGGVVGAAAIARALGVRASGETTVRQEQLW